ncbi:MAG: serine/threonine protein kinase [Burkholderiales bacterium]|nr:MAG: serine/threonine protein kinase [Burkholderiales bacterium]
MPKANAKPLLGAFAILLGGILWVLLRSVFSAQLADAAQRDLWVITELVAVDLKRGAERSGSLRGVEVLRQDAGAHRELVETLRRAGDQKLRTVYFFDRIGRVLSVGTGPTVVATEAAQASQIVREAARSLADPAREPTGVVFEPYLDREEDEVVGVWQWNAAMELGIVAERPYDRFIRPLRWFDGVFIALLFLAALAYGLYMQFDFKALRLAFRKPDLETCGPYQILRLIGEGAMANVYLARHQHLGRVVALKRLKLQSGKDETLERFDREARLASQLHHPNIITVLDHGPVPGGGFYYAMEYIQGLTLTQWVEEHGPVPPGRVIRLLEQICAAVGAMHVKHLLHRDIKPDNVIAYAAHGDYDLVKLLDFGLIRDLDHEASRDLTRGLRVLGTPAFMAPERLLDPKVIDPRTDLYGIGCIGYFLLTGRRPFEATLDADLAQQVLHVPAPRAAPNSIFSVPTRLDDLIDRALAKDMALRPESAAAFAAELEGIAKAAPWHREPARLWWMSVQAEVSEGNAAAKRVENSPKG